MRDGRNLGPVDRRCVLRRIGAGALLVAVAPLLTACPVTAPQSFLVQMTGNGQYLPSSLEIPRGATVVWQNRGTTPHTATCDPALVRQGAKVQLPSGASAWDSDVVYAGDTWTRRFDTPGTYIYFSRYREMGGMIGSITVRQ